mmetsp:Transcript_35257/g.43517  ORF Transcript_35257/g.43517 Transcript_35257/m.43517 type:complete len:178 (-) Transcript_35257:553-1086(-)
MDVHIFASSVFVASVISVIGCTISLLVPWVTFYYRLPNFGPGVAGKIKGPQITVGLFKCFSEICGVFEKAADSPNVYKIPVQFTENSTEISNLYRITVFVALGTIVCLVLSLSNIAITVSDFKTGYDRIPSSKSLELQILGNFCLILGCGIYSCIAMSMLDDAYLKLGFWSASLASG